MFIFIKKRIAARMQAAAALHLDRVLFARGYR